MNVTRLLGTDAVGRAQRLGAMVVVLGALLAFGAGVGGAATPTPPFNECPAFGQDTSCGLLINLSNPCRPTIKIPEIKLFRTKEGQTFSGPVAIFTDNQRKLVAQASDYSASVNWGDGSPTTTGTVSGPLGGPFTVSGGPHVYAEEGTYTVTVSVTQTANNTGSSILQDPTQGPYDGIEDTLIGVLNNCSSSVSSLPIGSSTLDIFGFDGDGIDTFGAPGNASDTSGYGGPDSYFTGISSDRKTGTVNFVTPLAPGQSTYFSLEEALSSACCSANTATISGPVGVRDVPLTVSCGIKPAKQQQGFSGTVVTFKHDNAYEPGGLSHFGVTIDWGDGSPVTMVPTSDLSGSSPNYTVKGSHFYATTGPKVIKVLVGDDAESRSTTCGITVVKGTPPNGSCSASSSLSVLVHGPSVVAYIPKGNWGDNTTGVSAVNVENPAVGSTLIPTTSGVNSCASNWLTLETVCTGNDNSVYMIKGTAQLPGSPLASGGVGTSAGFSGGDCTNCGISMDAAHNKALISMSTPGGPGFQYLDLATNTFESTLPSQSSPQEISGNPTVDPYRNLLLSAAETNNYEIADVTNSASPLFYENQVAAAAPDRFELDSTAEDCSTGITLAPAEYTVPTQVYFADLDHRTTTPATTTTPGTWTAPSVVKTLTESSISPVPGGSAVAQGTNIAFVAGEFGGDALTAIKLPTASSSLAPVISSWTTCHIGNGFSMGNDPHTLTAYQDPPGGADPGDAIALLENYPATMLARVDLTKMFALPQTSGSGLGHACSAGTLPASVVTFFPN